MPAAAAPAADARGSAEGPCCRAQAAEPAPTPFPALASWYAALREQPSFAAVRADIYGYWEELAGAPVRAHGDGVSHACMRVCAHWEAHWEELRMYMYLPT